MSDSYKKKEWCIQFNLLAVCKTYIKDSKINGKISQDSIHKAL